MNDRLSIQEIQTAMVNGRVLESCPDTGRGDRMLIVNGVPCTECTYCGERFYEADVLVRIESDFDAIEDGTRVVEKRLSVPVEDFSRLVG